MPTEAPESDGTLAWDATTIVVAEVSGGGERGIGYAYAHQAAAGVIDADLVDAVVGCDAMAVGASWQAMVDAVRNIGRPGIAAGAISAVDGSLWDLKAKLLGLPLVSLLGQVRTSVVAYASGGFTSYTERELVERVAGYADDGFRAVKVKVGRDPEADPRRVEAARGALGDDVALMVDANGAYQRKQALELAGRFAESDVTWFEEPVTSDDLEGLHLVRDRGPAGMDVAAGEYGYDQIYFRRMLDAGAVDCLQADATRCLGLTGFLATAALCEAHAVELSAHTAPALHLHVCCAARPIRHLEYFHDHARLEPMLFEGVVTPVDGVLVPDLGRPGIGIELREADAARYEVAT